MATNVQVVLKQDMDKLGRQGELIRVRAGYARNYLIPRKLAAMATRKNIEQIEHERRLAAARLDKLREATEVEAKQVRGLTAQIAKEAGPEGKLFGSVTAQDVADALQRRGVDVDRKRIVMPDDAIKLVGDYDLAVKYAHGVRAEFQLTVVTKA